MRGLILIPAYNEEKTVSQVILSVRSAAPDVDIVVINDNSSDCTEGLALSLNVPVISLPVNLGIGGAVQTGILYALKNGYDWAIQFDGDGQHQAKYLIDIIDTIQSGCAHLVIGSRYISTAGSFRTSAARRLGMILFSWLFRVIAGQTIYDTTSGFRAYSGDLMRILKTYYPTDFPDMPVLVLAHKCGFRIKEIPVEMNQREFGHSSTNFAKSLIYPARMIIATIAILVRKDS